MFRLYWEKPLLYRLEPKFAWWVASVITYAKFQAEIFRGYDFTNPQISHLPTDFGMSFTTVQRYCAACDHGCAAVAV